MRVTLHRLKSIDITEENLSHEIERLVREAVLIFGEALVKIVQFGSSLGGVVAMHQYSDIDLCVILEPTTSHKSYFGRLPVSTLIPVDWILVNKDEFDEKAAKRHGVFHLVNSDGRIVWDRSYGKI
jgi:predicted nucleotidyltransferase